MKERPIIFSGESVRAILAGRKTQTRRALGTDLPFDAPARFAPCDHPEGYGFFDTDQRWHRCPFGRPGDRLWVQEAWSWTRATEAFPNQGQARAFVAYREQYDPERRQRPPFGNTWRSPVSMPRWASRITLDVVSVRVEKLQTMNGADAQAEGYQATPVPGCGENDRWCHDTCRRHGECQYRRHPLVNFWEAWDALNAKRGYGWDENPWVWVVGFKRTEDER